MAAAMSGNNTTMTDDDDECKQTSQSLTMIVNELLTYSFYYMKNFPVDTIKTVLINFYGADAIHQAKVALWDGYVAYLPKWADRRKGSGMRQQERELDDILRGVFEIDKRFGDGDDFPCRYVAANLRNVPSVKPGAGPPDSSLLADRVTALERQISTLVQQMAAVSDIQAARKETYPSVIGSPVNSAQPPATTTLQANDHPHSSADVVNAVHLPETSDVQRYDDGFILPPE